MTTAVVEAPALNAADARALTDKIRMTLQFGHKLISEAYVGRAWEALGYDTWDTYCAGEFTEARMIRLDREQRREIVADLRVQGMPSRAIGTALGVDDSTIRSDVRSLTGGGNPPPAPNRVTGVDGKSYPANVNRETGEVSDSPAPQRAYAPRTDVVRAISTALTRARDAAFAADEVKREHLTNRSEEAAAWSRGLSESMESLQRLLDLFTEATT